MQSEYEKYGAVLLIISAGILLFNIYYYSFALLRDWGATWVGLDYVIAYLRAGGIFSSYLWSKLACFAFLAVGVLIRKGTHTDMSWATIALLGGLGLILFFIPVMHPLVYMVDSVLGYVLCLVAISYIRRMTSGISDPMDSFDDTFPQCEELIETPYSINIPTKYQWQGRLHNGWINVVNPFRGTIVTGTPGSGKSFSVYGPFIEQMIAKGYTMFVYDYKYPDLTEIVYNELIHNPDGYRDRSGKARPPQFYTIDFNDPMRSHRCNPVNPKYITDPADTSEIAQVIMNNVNPTSVQKKDFFTESAQVYLDALLYFLSIYDPDAEDPVRCGTRKGCFCTFPHLIELMGQSYKTIFQILNDYEEVRVKITTFNDAWKDKAMEQLQGQIASARIPLSKFVSPSLYWVLSGDDFTLDINNPDEPKIVCIGNDPDRQAIYGTTLALFTSRLFKAINHKGRLHSAVLLDEMPTIYLKGIDQLIATCRSNKVAVVVGAQDKSQVIRDYTKEDAETIFNTVGNVFSGQVSGETAQNFAKTFGQEWREEQSVSDSETSQSITRNYRLQDILPASKIETLSQGTFFGKVQDNNDTKIKRKFFCGEIQIDMKRMKEKQADWQTLPVFSDFGTDDKEQIHEIIMENYRRIKKDIEELLINEAVRIAAKMAAESKGEQE